MRQNCRGLRITECIRRQGRGRKVDILYLEELDLLVFTQKELGSLTPVRGVLPTVFDQAGRVAIDLRVISR